MAGEPPAPPPSGAPQRGGRAADGEAQQRDERVGALAIARHVKDDGRALILYSHDARERA